MSLKADRALGHKKLTKPFLITLRHVAPSYSECWNPITQGLEENQKLELSSKIAKLGGLISNVLQYGARSRSQALPILICGSGVDTAEEEGSGEEEVPVALPATISTIDRVIVAIQKRYTMVGVGIVWGPRTPRGCRQCTRAERWRALSSLELHD
ncbi:hypothetical protein M0804_001990 [Polistes exclamans]|nr:hypothetical protein M0804_001990 [Polistes exclamans]